MQKIIQISALLAIALLTACGGGGGSDKGSSTPPPSAGTPPPVVVAPPAATITNPLTGAAAPGSPTASISGLSVPGAIVTAYLVNPDGSSGAVLGTANAATVAGGGGEFTVTLPNPTTSWVRLVARGGKYERKADNSYHPVESLELVTPFVTSTHNYLVISPVTDVASRIMTYKAKTGSTLVDAFKFGMVRTLQLDVANLTLQDDVTVYLNVLKGRITTDKGYSQYQSLNLGELNMGIERFGVMYDLPQSQVWRAIPAAGENSYPLSTVDGAGAHINVGAWVNGSFDAAAQMSLKALMNAKTLDEIKVTDNSGARVAPRVSDMVSRYLIQDAYLHHSCTTGVTGIIRERYPFFPVDTATGMVPASTCVDVARRMAHYIKLLEANNTFKMK